MPKLISPVSEYIYFQYTMVDDGSIQFNWYFFPILFYSLVAFRRHRRPFFQKKKLIASFELSAIELFFSHYYFERAQFFFIFLFSLFRAFICWACDVLVHCVILCRYRSSYINLCFYACVTTNFYMHSIREKRRKKKTTNTHTE